MAEKKSYTGNPGWLKWLVLAFIGYAVYLHFTGQKMTPQAPRETGKAGLTQSSRNASSLPDVTDSNIKIGGDIKGSGDEAQCGQTAKVQVSAILPGGKEYQGKAVPEGITEVNVGKTDATYPWMAGLSGMSAGGVREILVPANYVFDETAMKEQGLGAQDRLRFKVQLDSLSPAADPDAIPLRVMDTLPDRGMMAYCGDTVTFNLVLWNSDGQLLYDSAKQEPLVMQLGDAAVFYGLDRAMLGMREGGVRTAIIPPAYITASEHPARKTLPEGQVALADIALIKVEKPTK